VSVNDAKLTNSVSSYDDISVLGMAVVVCRLSNQVWWCVSKQATNTINQYSTTSHIKQGTFKTQTVSETDKLQSVFLPCNSNTKNYSSTSKRWRDAWKNI